MWKAKLNLCHYCDYIEKALLSLSSDTIKHVYNVETGFCAHLPAECSWMKWKGPEHSDWFAAFNCANQSVCSSPFFSSKVCCTWSEKHFNRLLIVGGCVENLFFIRNNVKKIGSLNYWNSKKKRATNIFNCRSKDFVNYVEYIEILYHFSVPCHVLAEVKTWTRSSTEHRSKNTI